jgi:hypothetical protein
MGRSKGYSDLSLTLKPILLQTKFWIRNGSHGNRKCILTFRKSDHKDPLVYLNRDEKPYFATAVPKFSVTIAVVKMEDT